jgi:hypothetical protein
MASLRLQIPTIGLVALLDLALMPGVAQAEGPDPAGQPVYFEGTFDITGWLDDGVQERSDGLTATRGRGYEVTITNITDDRLGGRMTAAFNLDEYWAPGAMSGVGVATWRIENEEGAWSGSGRHLAIPSGFSTIVTTTMYTLQGEGAYEGHMATMEADFDDLTSAWAVRGLILETSCSG